MERILIPSKSRAGKSKLIALLIENKIDFIVFVEPQECAEYIKAYPEQEINTIPENDKGITFVRNYMKEFAEEQEYRFYWQLDDDISKFYKRVSGKMKPVSPKEALEKSEHILKKNNIALGALEYQQFAWSSTKDFTLNSFCDSCVFVNNKMTKGMRYDAYVEGKEDRDFAMQIIDKEMNTARVTVYGFAAPENGSNQGGLKEIFYDKEGREEITVDRLVEKWGDYIVQKRIKPSGRIDAKIHWKRIQMKQNSLF